MENSRNDGDSCGQKLAAETEGEAAFAWWPKGRSVAFAWWLEGGVTATDRSEREDLREREREWRRFYIFVNFWFDVYEILDELDEDLERIWRELVLIFERREIRILEVYENDSLSF